MANELPRYTARYNPSAGSADLSQAQGLQNLSSVLSNFANTLQSRIDTRLSKEQSAMDDNYLANVKADGIENATKIANTVGADYDLFETNKNEFIETYLNDVPDRLKGQARSKLVYQFTMKGADVFKKKQEKINADAITSKTNNIQALATNMNDTAASYISEMNNGMEIDSSASQFYTESFVEDFSDMNNLLDELGTMHDMPMSSRNKIRDEVKGNLLKGVITSMVKIELENDTSSKFMNELTFNTDKFLKDNYFMQLFPEGTITLEDRENMIEHASQVIDDITKKNDRQEKIEKEKLEESQQNYYFGVVNQIIENPGSLTLGAVDNWVGNKLISPEQGNKLKQRIKSGEDIVTDQQFVFQLEQAFADPSMSRYMLKNMVLNGIDKLDSDKLKEYLNRADKEVSQIFDRKIKLARQTINIFRDESSNPMLRAFGVTVDNETSLEMELELDEMIDNIGVVYRTANEFYNAWSEYMKNKQAEVNKNKDKGGKKWSSLWPGTADDHDINKVKIYLKNLLDAQQIGPEKYKTELEALQKWQ